MRVKPAISRLPQILVWIFQNPRVDLMKSSCGFSKILVWIVRTPHMKFSLLMCAVFPEYG